MNRAVANTPAHPAPARATNRIDSRFAVFDAALDAIVTIDHQGRIVEFNVAAEQTFGWTRGEVRDRFLAETIVPHRFRAQHVAGLQRYLATGETRVLGRRIEVAALRADGSEFPAELAITRVPDADPPLFTGFVRDLTDQRRTERRRAAQYRVAEILAAETTLEESAPALLATLNDAFDAAFSALWSMDGDELRCVAAHGEASAAGASGMVGRGLRFRSGTGVPGRIWQTGAPLWIENVLDDPCPCKALAQAAGLHAAFGFPVQLHGEVLAVFEFFSLRILERDDDTVRLFESIGRQVAQFMARKRAEDDRARLLVQEHRARLDAEESNHSKDDFVTMISHELRTPLNTILGWSAILKNGATKPETCARAIDAIERGARAQAQLIEDLLDISRIGRGTLVVTCGSIDAAATVRAAIELVQLSANDRGVSLDASGVGQSIAVWADKARLQQIILNLLSNAIKFTPAGGSVAVTLTATDAEVEIVVRDTGAGIRADFLALLFEPFRQGDIPARGGASGLGLGLAIVQHLAHAHGGTVTAASGGEGQGSTFTVRLPRAGPKASTTTSSSSSSAASVGESSSSAQRASRQSRRSADRR